MRLNVIACGVFEPYLRSLAAESPHEVSLTVLDAGLHARPNDLRILAQEAIDNAERAGADAAVLFYGLCGRGASGLVAHRIPVVFPRAHDCITLFLGSREAYLKQFAAHPGTFYSTLGWIEKSTHPRNPDAAHLYHDYPREGYTQHPQYPGLERKYGADNAAHVLTFLDRWKRHYTRAAYIDLGLEGETACAAYARQMAATHGWEYENIPGDAGLLRRMLSGAWDDDRLFVLPPGHRSDTTGDERLYRAVPLEGGSEDAPDFTEGEVNLEDTPGSAREGTGIGLGIDAGGTYTDAVLYDLGSRRVLGKAKALTTYHDFVEGIREALALLAPETLAKVQVTALSTTLATNAIVEGRGHKVGLIVLAPWDWFAEDITHAPCIRVPGCVDATGEILEPLDEEACRHAVERLVNEERCAALVVAGYGTVRNPAQASRVREIAREGADVPVVCAHEVSRRLDAVRGARTAVANARLLPVIQDLIASVHTALQDYQVPGRLMVVKGDGTPVDEQVARERPIETILSGPAASVSGAKLLTGLADALVMDIGGTTTDCAVLEGGHVGVSPEGARVGPWVMSVDVVDIVTVGLGGDSRLDFTRDREMTIGPQRNIPFCYLAHRHPAVAAYLHDFDERRYRAAPDASCLDVLARAAPARLALTETEQRLLDLLADGPVPVLQAAERLGVPTYKLLPLARLEACGAVQRGALTPTDLLHVSGVFARWDAEAAGRALTIFAAMLGRSPEQTLEEAFRRMTRRVFEEAVRREVSLEDRRLHNMPDAWDFLLDRAFSGNGTGLGVKLSLRRPIVAIGAPAAALVPPVSAHLGTEVVVPEHADVANAVGAIGTEITVREEVVIQPGTVCNYVLYATDARLEFAALERATEKAAEIARARAVERAIVAGAQSPGVRVSRWDRAGTLADGGRIFLERRVTATATGAAFAPVPGA